MCAVRVNDTRSLCDAGRTTCPECSSWITRRLPIHYACVVTATTLVVLIVTAGICATPGVLMVPLETEFGWRRTVIVCRRRQHRALRVLLAWSLGCRS